MKPIWRVLRYIRYYPTQLVLHIGLTLLHTLFSLSAYVLIIPFLELLFGMSQPPSSAPDLSLSATALSDYMLYHLYAMKDSLGVWKCLLIISGAYLSMSFMGNLCRFLSQFFIAPIRNGITQHLRDDIYQKITILPVSYFNSRRRGDIISRMSNDLADVEWSITTTITALIKEPINIIFFSATLIIISPKLFGLMLVIAPIMVFLIGLIGNSLKRNSFKGQTALGGLFSILEEGLGGIRTIKAFNQEENTLARFRQGNNEYTRRMIRVAERRELSGPLSEVLATLVLVAILLIGASLVFGGEMLSSTFIFFVLIFLRLIPPIQSIIKAYNNLQKGNASAQRFFQIMDADERITEQPNAYILRDFSKSIEYRDVSFAYTTDKPGEGPVTVLDHINLTITRNKHIAIVGPSGAGKTTLVDLLPRFYDCTGGEIAIDNHALPTLNITSLRSLIGEVSQHCILFNDTVANNIAFGHHYERHLIEEAARLAHADDFIRQLPQGYDTPIGDRGLTLSGGQRQRLSIARALLKDPPILILDEATSALDAESECAVQQALQQLMHNRTTITIAHRLATIQNADEIIVMDKGRIVEHGDHSSLMSSNGLYRHLVEMQLL
ncbi:MAG: ABC transporter ATP-binding protein [Bacteroidales bacterium]|nr:ABC transporter ATP-binding protein [Bacteroidales bacterium]